ncbi:MAG: four helix bundle protein [Ferruginibacter sp.]|nr:four helix bundle protein [Ferruginibacter sp.]
MASVKRFEELQVWQLSRDLNKIIGELIDKNIFNKNYRIINQIEGSSGSIMDNIAEGFERGTKGEFIQFLGYSKGSCGELRSQLYRAKDRGYINQEQFNELANIAIRISAMIFKLISYLQVSAIQGNRKKTFRPLDS